jgi:hypothetical protein
MARYNSALASASITGATTIGSPYSGAFTEFTGTGPYTVTLPSPSAFPGQNQTFYNITGSTITLSTPSGAFNGTGGSGTSTVSVYNGNVVSVTSDGTNYIVISEDGSALVATTASISGDVTINGGSAVVNITAGTVTLAPTNASNINNMAIGSTTRASGAFTTLAANNAVSFTANTASTSTTTGSLVVTGGLGVSGTITAATANATNLGGTLSTAAQPNITSATGLTSVGTLTALTVSGLISAQRGVNFGGYNAISFTSSGAMGIYGHNAYADQNATNRVLQINNSYYGHFIRMYYDQGIAFHTRTSAGAAGDVLYDFATPSNQVADVAERIRILPNGNLGIGISSPASPLHVYQASGGSNHITLSTGFSSGNSYAINPFITSVSNGGFSIRDVTNAVERLVIQYSTGNIGIGTTSPQTNLDINGNIIARGDIFFGTKPANTLTTGPNNTAWHHIGYAGGTNYHITGSVQGDMTVGAIPGTGIIFGTATNAGDAVPVQRVRIAPNGTVSINNDLSVGTAVTVGTNLFVTNSITFNTAGGPGYFKYAFFTLSTYGGNGYVHMKTDQRTNNSNMYRIEATGYDYGSAQVIGGAWSGYLYSGTDSILSIGRANWGNRVFCYSEYKSADGYLVLVADTASYYNSFVLHYQAGATGAIVPTITAYSQSTATSGVY